MIKVNIKPLDWNYKVKDLKELLEILRLIRILFNFESVRIVDVSKEEWIATYEDEIKANV